MKINKKYHFYAAHRNHAGGEKCGRIHGHTYDIECTFEFDKVNDGGITMLFSDIDKHVEPIIKSFCHWFLIYDKDPLVEVLELANEPIKKLPFETSVENLSVWIFNLIKKELPIVKITLAETKSSIVEYEPK
tara:strand:+ start:541 stop:936 length:396 start_codon:yes stop_codon:yes gene_type:complete